MTKKQQQSDIKFLEDVQWWEHHLQVDVLMVAKFILTISLVHEEPLILFSDYYNLRRKSCASESGNISNSGQPHAWFINIVCACIYGINEEFSKEKSHIFCVACEILLLKKLFWRISKIPENQRGSCSHASRCQWIDGQSSSWWRYTWRLWLAEFLWHVLPSTGLYSVFLWESKVWV